jgi:hypothetical protein
MELRNWVQSKFGGTGSNSLLDESQYSSTDLRKDITKLEHSLKQQEKEMDEHHRKYKELLKEGANASELERKKYAQKAKFEKKKYAVKKKKYRASSIKYGTLLSVQGMREIMDLQDTDDLAIDEQLEDADVDELQGQIMERMAAFGVEMEDMQEIQEALDIPIMEDNLATDTSEEEEIMEQMAASDISAEQVDIDAGTDIDLGDTDLDDDLDIGDIDETELEV